MSRSKRKNPFIGIADDSDWEDKRHANRRFRRWEKDALKKDREPPEDLDEVSDEWGFGKDGKRRFDPEDRPDLMRK